jgi:hypothetical protein
MAEPSIMKRVEAVEENLERSELAGRKSWVKDLSAADPDPPIPPRKCERCGERDRGVLLHENGRHVAMGSDYRLMALHARCFALWEEENQPCSIFRRALAATNQERRELLELGLRLAFIGKIPIPAWAGREMAEMNPPPAFLAELREEGWELRPSAQ